MMYLLIESFLAILYETMRDRLHIFRAQVFCWSGSGPFLLMKTQHKLLHAVSVKFDTG